MLACCRRLCPLAPIDNWINQCFVSLVGFRFLDTRVRGITWPFHRNFDEVNLRFYVRRREGTEWRRGVVFIREIVPRWAIATVAKALYNERYMALPMAHTIRNHDGGLDVQYEWIFRRRSNALSVAVKGDPALPDQGSEAHFITEHFWGYSAQRDGGCMEYQVEHPSWAVWAAVRARFEGDAKEIYGADLGAVLQRQPDSAFVATGSAVTVHRGRRI